MNAYKNTFDDIYDEYKTNIYNKINLINKLPSYLKTKDKLNYLDKLLIINVFKYCSSEIDMYETFIIEKCNKLLFEDAENVDLNTVKTLFESLQRWISYRSDNELKKINEIYDNVTELTFVNFLRYQHKSTTGVDYPSYYYLIKYFNLKIELGMIVFTDEFPFDKRIKKEALGIWYILNIIETDPTLSIYTKYLQYVCQKQVECDLLSLQYCIKPDLWFNIIDVVFEIDEAHHSTDSTVIEKDQVKNAIYREMGLHVYRLEFYETIKPKSYEEIKQVFRGALQKYDDFLQDYLKHAFINTFNDKINKYNSNIILENEYVLDTLNNIAISEKNVNMYKDQCNLAIKYMESANVLKNDTELILDDFTKSSEFHYLFNLKKKSKTAKNKSNITFEEILRVFGIDNDDDLFEDDTNQVNILTAQEFKDFMIKQCIIHSYTTDNDIMIDWKELVQLIYEYPATDSKNKETLLLYHREIEDIYDNIMKDREHFISMIISNKNIFNMY